MQHSQAVLEATIDYTLGCTCKQTGLGCQPVTQRQGMRAARQEGGQQMRHGMKHCSGHAHHMNTKHPSQAVQARTKGHAQAGHA